MSTGPALPDAITEVELAAALAEEMRRNGGTHYVMAADRAAETAAVFFKTALGLREPEYAATRRAALAAQGQSELWGSESGGAA